MRQDACHQHRTEQIRRVSRNDKETVQHEEEHEDHGDRAEKSQLLTDHREDHIVLRLRKEA